MPTTSSKKIAVIIPCFNEEQTIKKVVVDFHDQLKNAKIFVIDNNSSDKTVEYALSAGAKVLHETFQGKGNVIRNIFRKVQADVYVLVDGDQTYPADRVADLIAPVLNDEADMVVGDRRSNRSYINENKRKMHNLGNMLVCGLINFLYNQKLNDVMSGYRVFNKFFLKNIPILAEGFEIEVEITLQALDKKFRILEIPIDYKERPFGSTSKLKTYSDGILVLKTIVKIVKHYKPLLFFGWLSLLVSLAGLLVGIPVISEFIKYKYIYKIPSAILASSLIVLGLLLFCCGLILDTIVQFHKERYLITINRSS